VTTLLSWYHWNHDPALITTDIRSPIHGELAIRDESDQECLDLNHTVGKAIINDDTSRLVMLKKTNAILKPIQLLTPEENVILFVQRILV
jgi:hypothetical protein